MRNLTWLRRESENMENILDYKFCTSPMLCWIAMLVFVKLDLGIKLQSQILIKHYSHNNYQFWYKNYIELSYRLNKLPRNIFKCLKRRYQRNDNNVYGVCYFNVYLFSLFWNLETYFYEELFIKDRILERISSLLK